MAELQRQLVQDRVDNLVKNLGIPEDEAFERLVYSLTTGGSAQTPHLDDWVDGGGDKQVDIITVEDGQGEADVYITQAKYVDSFSSNALILMGNGLQWIFTADKNALSSLENTDFRDKIQELRSTLAGYGYSNARIHCYFVTKAPDLKLSVEFKQELARIKAKFDNGTFESFDVKVLSSEELIELSKRAERRSKAVDVDLPIRYDANTPSVIKYQSQGQKGVICTCDAKQIASSLWRGVDVFNQTPKQLNKEIDGFKKNTNVLVGVFPAALKLLEQEIKKNPAFSADIDVALRSSLLDSAITKRLNTKPKKTKSAQPNQSSRVPTYYAACRRTTHPSLSSRQATIRSA